MRYVILALFLVSLFGISSSGLRADNPSKKKTEKAKNEPAESKSADKEQPAERPDNLVPLYRFYNTITNEHAYTHKTKEIEAWRNVDTVKEHFIVGDVSPVELPGTTRLWRAVRDKDKRHYYYLRAPGKAVRLIVDNENFACYVWKKPGEGRIPIYATTWTDGTDCCFDSNLDSLRKFREDTKKALGTYRLSLGGADYSIPVFYVYSHPKEDSAKETRTESSQP